MRLVGLQAQRRLQLHLEPLEAVVDGPDVPALEQRRLFLAEVEVELHLSRDIPVPDAVSRPPGDHLRRAHRINRAQAIPLLQRKWQFCRVLNHCHSSSRAWPR
ncbi:hypothetical protein D9M71_668360 [compost metagenome]